MDYLSGRSMCAFEDQHDHTPFRKSGLAHEGEGVGVQNGECHLMGRFNYMRLKSI